MRHVLVFALAAALTGSAAAADVPAGFVAQPVLAQRAAFVAGKPVAVLCAADDASWSAEEATHGQVGTDHLGHVDAVSGSTIYLSPTVCSYLLMRVAGRAIDLVVLGAALEVYTHEAEHLAGSTDEGATECAALAVLPSFLRAQWGFKNALKIGKVMRGAYSRHRAAEQYSPAYVGACG
jgi:hypothetical protein